MEIETINNIELLDSGELLVGLEGKGKPMYQYIYREAVSVYWDDKLKGFKSTELKEWSCSKWFSHIVSVVKAGLGVELLLSANAEWKNIPEQDKQEIIENYAI